MAKIRKTIVSTKHDGIERVEVHVHYIPEHRIGYNRSIVPAHFFIEIPHKYAVKESALLTSIKMRNAKELYGCTGETEDHALAKTKEFFDWYATAQIKRDKFIFIVKEKDDWNREGDVSVTFKYLVVTGVTLPGAEPQYEVDREYHTFHQALYKHNLSDYTIIPFTSEVLAACESIIAEFKAVQKKINNLFATPDKATKVLTDKSNKLLTA